MSNLACLTLGRCLTPVLGGQHSIISGLRSVAGGSIALAISVVVAIADSF
jgi:hypothetical protein